MDTTIAHASVRTATPPGRPYYTRLAALGFGLIAVVGVIVAIYGLINGNTDEIIFVLPIMIIALLIAGALLRFGAWAEVLGGLLALALLALILPFSTFTLMHPEDASNFIPLVGILAGAALGLVGCVVSLIQRGRHMVRTAATPVESLAVKFVLAALVVVGIASIAMSVSARTTVSPEAKANALGIEIKSFSFNPNRLQVKSGETVRIVFKNDDPTLHTFTLPEAGVNVSIPPGSEKLVEFQAPAAGEYRWYCIPHSDPGPDGRTGMVGELQVQ